MFACHKILKGIIQYIFILFWVIEPTLQLIAEHFRHQHPHSVIVCMILLSSNISSQSQATSNLCFCLYRFILMEISCKCNLTYAVSFFISFPVFKTLFPVFKTHLCCSLYSLLIQPKTVSAGRLCFTLSILLLKDICVGFTFDWYE